MQEYLKQLIGILDVWLTRIYCCLTDFLKTDTGERCKTTLSSLSNSTVYCQFKIAKASSFENSKKKIITSKTPGMRCVLRHVLSLSQEGVHPRNTSARDDRKKETGGRCMYRVEREGGKGHSFEVTHPVGGTFCVTTVTEGRVSYSHYPITYVCFQLGVCVKNNTFEKWRKRELAMPKSGACQTMCESMCALSQGGALRMLYGK